MKKIKKPKNVKHLILMNVQNKFIIDPFLPKEYNLFSQNIEISIEQYELNLEWLKSQ